MKRVADVPSDFWDLAAKAPAQTLEEREVENERFVRERMMENRAEAARVAAHKFGIDPSMVELMVRGDYKRTRAISEVKRLLSNPESTGLILAGAIGVGKTFAAAYAWLHRDVHQDAEFIKAPDLRMRVTPWRGEPQAMDLDAYLMVIDDLGTERTDEYFQVAFQKTMDARMRGTKTIITTNLSPQQMRDRYNPRTIDRMRRFAYEGIGGESMREREEGNPL